MRKVYILATVLIIFPHLIPSVNAYDDSVAILLFVSDPEEGYHYDIGETVPVKVLFFDKGELIDADTNPTITLNEYSSNKREITLSKTGMGVYNGNFTIIKSDVDDDYIMIDAKATLGKENETDIFYDEETDRDGITVSDEGRLGLEFEFDYADSMYISATSGDTIYIAVTVKNNGTKINPDRFILTADDESIEYTNPSIGIFKANYTISPTLSESTYINIKAEAEHDNETAYEEGTIRVHFWNIWIHKVNVNETHAQFELCVADVKGKAVSGAKITFNYDIDDYIVDYNSPSKSGTTNSQGKALFSIDHDSASFIYLGGSVEFSGKAQNFGHSIRLSSEEDSVIEVPDPYWDFQVIYQKNIDKIEIGNTVTLDYMAYEGTNPLPDQLIYYYIYTEEKFLKSGSTTTDSSAKFAFNFTVPETSYWVDVSFESPFEKEYSWEHGDCDDDLVYRKDRDFIPVYSESEAWEPDESIVIEIDTLTIGEKTTVKASRPDSEDYDVDIWLLVGNYSLEDLETGLRHDWEQLTSVDTYPSSYYYPMLKEGRFIWEFYLEEFLPLNETYTIFLFFSDPNEPFEGFYFNYINIKPVERPEDENGDQNVLFQSPIYIGGIGISWLTIIIIIVIIISIIVIILRRRRIRAKPIKSDQLTPSSTIPPSQQVPEQSYPPKDS